MVRDSDTIQSLLEGGLEALNRGDYERALAQWNEVLETEPGHSRAARLVRDLTAYVESRSRFDDAEESSIIVVIDDAGVTTEPVGRGRQRIGSSGDFPRAPNLITRQALERLQQIVDDQRGEVDRITDVLGERDEQILDLRTQLTARDRELLELREASLGVEKTAARSERERRELERVRQKLDEDLAAAELSVADHRKDIERYQTELDALRDERTALSDARNALRDERDTLSSRLEAAEDDARNADARVESLEAELLEFRNALTSERAAADEVRDELNAARTQLKLGEQTARRAQGELESTRQTLREAEAARDAALAEREDTRRAAAELEEAHRDAAQQRAELAEALDRARADYERLLASAQETSDQLAAAARDLEAREAELAEYREHADLQLEHTRGELQRLLDVVSERDAIIDDLSARAEAADALAEQLESLQPALAIASDERDALAAEREHLVSRIAHADERNAYAAELEEQLDSLRLDMRKQADQLEEVLEATRQSISFDEHERICSLVEVRDAELEALRARVAELGPPAEQSHYLAAEHERIAEENEHLRQRADDLEDELDRLRQDMKATYSVEAVAVESGEHRAATDLDLVDAAASPRRARISVEQAFEEAFNAEFEIDVDVDADTGASLAVAATDPSGLAVADVYDDEVDGGEFAPGPGAVDVSFDELEELEDVEELDDATDDATDDPTRRATVRHQPFDGTRMTQLGTPALAAESSELDDDVDDDDIVFALADDPAPSGAYTAVSLEEEQNLVFALADDPASSGEYDAAAPPVEEEIETAIGDAGTGAVSARQRIADDSLDAGERLSWILDEIPALTGSALRDLRNIGAREAFIVQNIDGNVSFGDLFDIVSLPPEETAAIIVELVNRGLVTSPSLAD